MIKQIGTDLGVSHLLTHDPHNSSDVTQLLLFYKCIHYYSINKSLFTIPKY